MARKKNKKNQPKVRNYVATEARAMSGAGKHQDRRTRRKRTRGARNRAALAEF